MVSKSILIGTIALFSFVTCREVEWRNATNEKSIQPSIFYDIQNGIWNEFIDPIPLIAAIITYSVLKFTGVLGFLRFLYTIIHQSNT